MSKKSPIILPSKKRILSILGENIKLARLRRHLGMEQVSSRAGISRPTLSSIEKGESTVSLGAYLQVLLVLGLEKDLLLIAKDDELGHKIQDAKLSQRERSPKNRR